ncbi:MAG: hypothetical protein JWN20_787, partial [Jatrophihabitantaceae bacterium]|nr:hypothetical protein [Jatrophihabitantaceae bacterium]
ATFDGRFYDFQAVGEFVAAIDSRGGFEVQVRQQQFADFADVAVNTAIALDVAGDKVEIASGIAGMTLTVGGEARPLDDGTLLRGGTIEIRAGERGPEVLVTWPDGSLANLSQIGTFGLLLRLRPAEAHAGHLRGLLGDFDGDPGNDVRIKGGDVITPTFGTLYPAYADSWRIAQADSLFAYASGKTTASYTDKSFPRAATSLEGIANLPRARAICIGAGIADPTQLENCMLDVGLTGHTEFADAYADAITSEASGSLTVDGAAVHVNLSTGQPTARYTFAGTAGQQIYVQATASTVPSECNVLRLYDPSGAAIASGCLIGGAGQIDTTTLPSTGTYTIAVAPAGGVAGTVTLKVLSVASTTNALTIDGPAVVATIAQPGGTASYTFSTTGPVDVYVQLSASTLPDQCSAVDLTDASGLTLGDGCVIGGEGEIDQTHLGAGSYMITVDPDNSATGRVTLKLIKDTDQTGSIAINGSAATGTIAQPGGTSTFTFKGAVGQKVAVEVSGSTFDDQCDLVELKQPNGAEIASACSISGKGSVDQIALPVSGEYTIVVNAYGPGTGSVRLKLTG